MTPYSCAFNHSFVLSWLVGGVGFCHGVIEVEAPSTPCKPVDYKCKSLLLCIVTLLCVCFSLCLHGAVCSSSVPFLITGIPKMSCTWNAIARDFIANCAYLQTSACSKLNLVLHCGRIKPYHFSISLHLKKSLLSPDSKNNKDCFLPMDCLYVA